MASDEMTSIEIPAKRGMGEVWSTRSEALERIVRRGMRGDSAEMADKLVERIVSSPWLSQELARLAENVERAHRVILTHHAELLTSLVGEGYVNDRHTGGFSQYESALRDATLLPVRISALIDATLTQLWAEHRAAEAADAEVPAP